MIITLSRSLCHLKMFCFANQLACVSCIISALVPLLIMQETVFLLSEYRQASEWQELVHKCVCPVLGCPEPEPALQEWEFPLALGLVTGFACRPRLRVDPSVPHTQ